MGSLGKYFLTQNSDTNTHHLFPLGLLLAPHWCIDHSLLITVTPIPSTEPRTQEMLSNVLDKLPCELLWETLTLFGLVSVSPETEKWKKLGETGTQSFSHYRAHESPGMGWQHLVHSVGVRRAQEPALLTSSQATPTLLAEGLHDGFCRENNAPTEGVSVLTPGSCQYVTLHSKGDSGNVIKLGVSRLGDSSGLLRQVQGPL